MRKKKEKKGKMYANSTTQHQADPCPPASTVFISLPGTEAFWKVLDKCPELTVAFCVPVLRRNFPSLVDKEAQRM